jgi:hypothetical protein
MGSQLGIPQSVLCAKRVRKGKPIEKYPDNLALQAVWVPFHKDGSTYRVKDGDSWESVAARFFLDTKDLIRYNFMTDNPDEVNWWLRNYVGCKDVSDSGNNYMFSRCANPGIIFIPPPDHDPIDVDETEICAWGPQTAQLFLMRLIIVAATIGGNSGARIKRLVVVIYDTGYPACKNLWYYNPLSIREYVMLNTGEARRREMTRGTNGLLPFDGNGGLDREWRIYPVSDLMDDFACKFDPVEVKNRLIFTDDQMYQGWQSCVEVLANSSQGGGTAYGPSVSEFIGHVNSLSKDKTSLYWAFSSD